MTALAAPYETSRKNGDIEAYPIAASTICYKGGLATVRVATGLVGPLRTPGAGTATDIFVGVFDSTVDNSADATGGALSVNVQKRGSYIYHKTTAAATDIGGTFYGVDDNTVSATSTNAVKVGIGVLNETTSTLRITIDPVVQ